MKFVALVISSAVVAVSAVLAQHAPATAAAGSVPFSAAQVAQGDKAYTQNCASCHGANLKGISGPALIGKTSGIAQQSVVEVYEYVSQQMPMTAPGSLSKAQYVSIVAYLLHENGHKPAAHPLTEAVATASQDTIVTR